MKIRSITLGTTTELGLSEALERAGHLLKAAAARFLAAGYEVQTTRVSLPPLRRIAGASDLERLARQVDSAAANADVGYVSLGPLRWDEDAGPARSLALSLPAALASSERVFGSIETADASGVRFEAVHASAFVIRALAESSQAGFGNLRFAALANCPPDIPFFPAAYHEAAEPAFGLALQAADLAVRVLAQAETLELAENELISAVETELHQLERIGVEIEAELGLRYAGADPTLAPFPSDDESIGAGLEKLGVGRFGAPGTLAGAALITRALHRVRARVCGFAGLMLPVLEDSVLAQRAAEGLFSWEELLLYSSVCGTGLDTVPLPGDISADELEAMILDVSTLSATLRKPLTCRLFPVPGKRTGDLTSFEFPFFANAGVLRANGGGSPVLMEKGLAGRTV